MKSLGKSDFSALVKYLTGTQDKQERVGEVEITNCNSIDVDSAMLEVLATQQINQRAKGDKTYHLMISFAPDEKVSEKALKEIEQRFIDALGFTDHQRISVVHHDTDSLHIHLAINKIHPTKHTMHEPYYDYKVRSALCETIENEYGLVKVNHQSRKNKTQNLSDDFEQHTGVQSKLNWIKEVFTVEIDNAENWKEMHKVLAEHDLIIKSKANGLVVADSNGKEFKASTIGREFSKQNLEKKFGTFVPMEEKAKEKIKVKARYVEKPISKGYDTTELYALYKRHQAQAVEARIKTQATAKERKASLIKSAKLSAKAKREALKLMKISKESKKILYKAISNSLMKRLGDIHKDYRKGNQLIYERCKQQTWADWLRTQALAGNEQAVKALRARSYKSNLVYDTITGKGSSSYVSHLRDGITKEGVVIYSSKYFSIRDDGKHIKVSRGVSHDGVTAALKIAVAKYGEVIKVDGNQDFKDQVVLAAATGSIKVKFEDAALNEQLKTLKEKYKDELKHRSGNSRSFGKPYGQRDATGTGRGMAGRATTKKAARKPDVKEHRSPPPTQRHNGMRELRELAMAFNSGRTKVLLPNDVSNNLDNRESGNHNELRRQPGGKKR
jgi:Relaxase/Mobilisation nuclease domain/Large polyvalent protein-associated domain 7